MAGLGCHSALSRNLPHGLGDDTVWRNAEPGRRDLHDMILRLLFKS